MHMMLNEIWVRRLSTPSENFGGWAGPPPTPRTGIAYTSTTSKETPSFRLGPLKPATTSADSAPEASRLSKEEGHLPAGTAAKNDEEPKVEQGAIPKAKPNAQVQQNGGDVTR